MADSMEDLERRVQHAHKSSLQGSYERRAPSAQSRVQFVQLRRELREMVSAVPSADLWRMLASVEEGLLAYPSALASLESAVALGLPRDRKTLKWRARLWESAQKWRKLALSPEDLAALGRHLRDALAMRGCAHTVDLTEAWLKRHKPRSVRLILNGLQDWNGYCDCRSLRTQ